MNRYATFTTHPEAQLDSVRTAGLFKRERVLSRPQGTHVRVSDGQPVLNLCANNHLVLAHQPEIKQAAHDALDEWGLRDHLEKKTRPFREGVTQAGFDILPFEHPIVPFMLGDAASAQRFAEAMLANGVYVVGVYYPVVPQGKARIRAQISTAHSEGVLKFAMARFAEVKHELSI